MHQTFRRNYDFPSMEARFPWIGGDLQTLANTLWPFLVPECERGDEILLSLGNESGEALMARYNEALNHGASNQKPLILLFHGLGGDENSSYMKGAAAYFLAQGFSILRINLRGTHRSCATSKGIYHAGLSSDIEAIIKHLPRRLCQNGLVLMGFSLGANVLLKFLGEGRNYEMVKAGIAISPPFDLYRTQQKLNQLRNRVYRRYLVNKLKRDYRAVCWKDNIPPIEDIEKLNSIIEFDECVIAPTYEFKDAMDYYRKCSAKKYTGNISLPTLIIQAADDPWIPRDVFDDFDWSKSEKVTFCMTATGGHVGFHSKDSRIPWHLRVTEKFLNRIPN